MKVTIKRIGVKNFIIWHTIMSLITGIFTGLVYILILLKFYSGEELYGYLALYIVGFPAMYFVLGLVTALIISLFYNSLSASLGQIKFEVEKEDLEHTGPPSPPTFEN